VESSLHRHLVEHLNSEIVLKTISDVSVAVEWLRSTFFFVRVLSNPGHYGFPAGLSSEELQSRLQGKNSGSVNCRD
jgi:Superfamily II helicase